MPYPRVSVIIPVFNRENLIERCLDSVVLQSRLPDELIVVDNGSADSTFHRVEEWMARHSDSGIDFTLLLENRKGACNARRKGFDSATGDVVYFFDSDDVMRPFLIEDASAVFNQFPDTDLVCWKCAIHQLDGTTRVSPLWTDKPFEGHLIHAMLRTQGYMIKRDFLSGAGGWGKDLEVWNDYELGLRILLKNPEIRGLDKIMADIYQQKESITGECFSDKRGLWENTLLEMKKEIDVSRHPEAEKLSKMLLYRRVILGAIYWREGNREQAERMLDLSSVTLLPYQAAVLKLCYLYTRKGLRGAWRMARFFLT